MNLAIKQSRIAICHIVIMLSGLISIVACDNTSQSATSTVTPIDNSTANVKFTEDSVLTKSGDDIVLSVVMQDLPPTEGGGLNLEYDASMLAVSSVDINAVDWTFVNRQGDIDNASGRVADVLFSNFKAVEGETAIAEITLKSLKPGKSRVTLSGSSVNPFASGGHALDVSYGAVEVVATN